METNTNLPLATFRVTESLSIPVIEDRPATPFFYTPNATSELQASFDSKGLDSTCNSFHSAYAEQPSGHSTCTTQTPASRNTSWCVSHGHRTWPDNLWEMEAQLNKLKAAAKLLRLLSIFCERRIKTQVMTSLCHYSLAKDRKQKLFVEQIKQRKLNQVFKKWVRLLQRRSFAELRFLLRKATSDNEALTAKLAKAAQQQRDRDLLLRQQKRDLSDLKQAVWRMWQNELHISDRRQLQLNACVRELVSISDGIEQDRVEKEPLLSIEFDDFFHRLLKHHRMCR
eukprot:Blabericola_migrator_1__9608@NODE_523_length_7872_cov_140_842409_g400_i0_p4_GENE_NODE_523_length_7872_cov_140_842409_g400_i0NODE_523_length_7872_cov_140_842409_g400_i0_p4_ORF_typecomplete_len283_score31_87HPS3_C/PF14763_6/0_17zfC3Hc3H/PF13891_6/54zfC3Hc3H/PF13891_6/3_5_NODE_523_length_7872_cov_140_842409_g400_i063837231